jgi:chemotaxis protein MotB
MTHKAETIRSFILKINQCADQDMAIIAVDDKGIIHFWNKQSETLLGYSSEDANHKAINELLLDENGTKLLFVAPYQENSEELDIIHKQGDVIRAEFKLAFFHISNTCIGIYYLKIATNQPRRVAYDIGTRPTGPLTPEYSLLEGTSLSNNGSEWLISYLDIMTLILIFFILAFSMSGGNKVNGTNEEATQFDLDATKEEAIIGDLRPIGNPNVIENDEPAWQYQRLLKAITQAKLSDRLDVIDSQGNISLRIKDNILFPAGRALISEQGELILDEITLLIQNENYEISVEGHTDSVPIASTFFPSNWELSSARATSVVRLLLSNGIDPQRLKATGYADTRPLVNTTEKFRPENRRVEIVLHIPKK